MRKYLILILILGALLCQTAAAYYYNPQHWLLGSLEAGAAPSADGHNAYSYYPPTSDAYATDVSGPSGNAAKSGWYMINAYDIPNIVYLPGMEIYVDVRGAYVAGPVSLTGSDAGFDLVPLMILSGGEIEIQAIAESGVNLRNGDFFPYEPEMTIKLADITIEDDITRSKLELKDAETQALVMTTEAIGLPHIHRFQVPIPDGTYDLTAMVWDNVGRSGSKTIEDLVVTPERKAFEITIDRTVWKAKGGEIMSVAYELSRDMDVMIYGYNVGGEVVKSHFAASGTMGGRAGYNIVAMDGSTNRQGMMGNGIYVFQITSGTKLLGKFKVVVAD